MFLLVVGMLVTAGLLGLGEFRISSFTVKCTYTMCTCML